MISVRYRNAITEVLQYLKGIRQEDVDKIPRKFMMFLQENASKEYECKFDYTKPLKDIELLDETKGIIGVICLNYWCETQEEKNAFINKMNENEKRNQRALREKYNPDNVFKNKNVESKKDDTKYELGEKGINLSLYKESVIKKIIKKIMKVLKK